MTYEEYEEIIEKAEEFAKCFARGNNCRVVSKKADELAIECLRYKLSKKRAKNHKYVVGVKLYNYGTKKWSDWARTVVLCSVDDECKTVKGHYRSHCGILSGNEIIGYF